MPDSSGFNSALQGQLRGVGTAVSKALGSGGAGGAIKNFNMGLRTMSDEIARASNRMIGMGEAMTYGLTRPLLGLAKTAVQASADFDLALRTIAAVSDIDAGEGFSGFAGDLGEIEDAARNLGRTTKFSAIEAAEGFTDLARAGLKPQEQIDAIRHVVNLATVEDIKLADATDRLINVYTGFGFKLGEVNKQVQLGDKSVGQLQAVTDVLARVSSATTASMTSLTDAFRYAGPVAAVAGATFEETAAALGVLDQAGFKATVGGTALRGVLTRLAVPTQVNEKTFEKLRLSVDGAIGAADPEAFDAFSKSLQKSGVAAKDINNAWGVQSVDSLQAFRGELGRVGIKQEEIFDQAGHARPLGEIVAIFADRYRKGMFKVGDAMKLFGQRAGPGFLALLQNEKLLQDVTEEAGNAAGASQNMADTIQKSAVVQFKMMKNSLIELSIAIGQSGVLEFFVNLAQDISAFANNIAKSNPEIFRLAFLIGGLVAAIGPLNIVLGLWGKAFQNFFVKPLILVSSPLALLAAGLAALVGFFGLMVATSEDLRSAFKGLFAALGLVLEPIVKLGGYIGKVLLGAIAGLAEWLGDKLAKAVYIVAEAINNWVRDGSLVSFLHGAIENVGKFVSGFYDLYQSFLDMLREGQPIREFFTTLGQIIENVEDAVSVLHESFEDIKKAFQEVGGDVFRTFAIAGGIVFAIIDKIAKAVEFLTRLLKPLADFLGNNMVLVLQILALKFIFLRGEVQKFAATGPTISKAFSFMGGSLTQKIGTTATGIQRLGQKIQGVVPATSIGGFAVTRFGQMVEGAGKRVDNAGIHMLLFGDKLKKLGAMAKNAGANVGIALGGMFAGQMAANAETAGEKIMAVAGALGALAMAASTGNPLLIGLTALGIIIGALANRASGARAEFVGLADMTDALTDKFKEAGGEIAANDFTAMFTEEINRFDSNNFTSIARTLELTGSNVTELGEAFRGGAEDVRVYAAQIEDTFINKQFSGELKNFKIEVTDINDEWAMLAAQKGIDLGIEIGDGITPAKLKEIQASMGDVNGITLKVENSMGGVTENVVGLGKVAETMAADFKSTFGGKDIIGFGNNITAARQKYEALLPFMKEQERQHRIVNDLQKTYVDRIRDANTALDETRQALLDLVTPQETSIQASAKFIAEQKGNIEALKEATGGVSATRPGGAGAMTAQAAAWDKFVRDTTTDWQSVVASVIAEMPAGLTGEEFQTELDTRLFASRVAYMEMLGGMGVDTTTAFGIVNTALVDQAGKLQEELSKSGVEFGKTVQGTALKAKHGWTDDIELQAYLDVLPRLQLANLIPAERQFLAEMFTNSGLQSEQIDVIINAIGKLDPKAPFNPADLIALIGFGVIAPTTIPFVVDVLPRVQTIPGLSELEMARLVANLSTRGLTADTATKSIDVLLNPDLTDPGMLASVTKLLSDKGIDTIHLPVAIDLQKMGVDIFGMDLAALLNAIGAASVQLFHSGGIVSKLSPGGSAKVSNIGSNELLAMLEVGEAVIPKDVVDRLGADTFRELIAGNIPSGAVNVVVVLTVEMVGAEMVGATFIGLTQTIAAAMAMTAATMAAGFASGRDAGLLMLDQLQSEFSSATDNMVNYIHNVVSALNEIPGIMESVGRSIRDGFSGPIGFVQRSVWPPFASVLNAAARAFGLGNVVPVFHEGGVVGSDGGSHRIGDSLQSDEMMALLQRGEGVMSQEMMASMTASQLGEFRRGNPRWFASGGPYEDGRGHVSSSGSDGLMGHDLEAMKAAYSSDVTPMLAVLQARYAQNVVAAISAKAVNKIAEGAFEWVRGANDESEAQMVSSIGLPPGFDVRGAVPKGFDIMGWRSFLGANKQPGNWPLLTRYLDAAGVPYLVNSTFRPGGTSYHASSRAVDFGAPGDANYDSPGLLRVNHALAPMLGVLSELIYSGPGGISDKAYDAATMAQHHNHVHAALARGGIVQGVMNALLGEAGPEVVLPLNNPGRALDIALASNLFSVLGDAAAHRQGYRASYGPSPLGSVPSGRSAQGFDGGFLGGGPGNTYNITGVGLDQVKTEIRNRDRAVARVRN